MNHTSVGVIGLGRLGLPVASLLSRYYPTVGLDIDQEKVASLNEGTFITSEPDCNTSRVSYYTTDYQKLIQSCDIAVICVNTPTAPDGTMDDFQLATCFKSLAKTLRNTSKDIKILVLSTIMPQHGAWLANFFSEFKYPPQIVVNPVWIAIGNVIKDIQNPPVQVFGDDSGKPILWALELWNKIPGAMFSPPIITDTRTASFLKLAHNAWCTMKMSFIGELGDKAKDLEIDINTTSEFFRSGGERPRAFWQYGPAFGGPCFPRDLGFFNQFTGSSLGGQARAVNERRIQDLITQLGHKTSVLIVGKTYKEGVDITEGSISLKLETALKRKECVVDFIDHTLGEMPEAQYLPYYEYIVVTQRGYERDVAAIKALEYKGMNTRQILELWK